MPMQDIKLRPGLNRESTSYANKGGWFAGDKIRFRSGFPGKIGGWSSLSNPATYPYAGVCRLLFNWSTLSSENLIAVGTNEKFYINNGGPYYDITPIGSTVTLGASPFATTSGSPLVTVTDTNGGVPAAGTWVTFSGATSVGGLTLNGSYELIQVTSASAYTVIAGSSATSTTTGGGASVTAVYQISAGNALYTLGTGWGAGGWGVSGWGLGSSTGVGIGQQLRLWSASNYGQDLVFSPQQGPIYYWVKDTTSYSPGVTLASLANAATNVTTTIGSTYTSGASSIVVSNGTGITAGAYITAPGISATTYVTTAYITGSTTVPLSAVTTGTGTSGSTITFSYAGQYVPTQTNQVLVSDASEFVFAFGANGYSPSQFNTTYNPMMVRWSDQGNAYQWVPSATNQSGQQVLSKGSAIVCARQTRQEILTWTDTALYSLQYVGTPYVWSTQLLMDNISIISSNAAITLNNVTYWMGKDKFFTYAGTVQPLPCSLRQFVYSNINLSQQGQIVAGGNEGYNEVWWFYPSANSLINDSYVVYNYLDNVWYYGTLNRTAWLDSSLQSYPLAAFSVQTSYLSLALSSTATALTLINASTYPSSGTLVIGTEQIAYTSISGNTVLGCTRGVNGTGAASHAQYAQVTYLVGNQIMYHENGTDDNSTPTTTPLYAYVLSSDFDIGDGNEYGFVWQMVPDITFTGSTSSSPSVNMALLPRQNPGAGYGPTPKPSVTQTASPTAPSIPPTASTYTVEQYTQLLSTRARGREMALLVYSNTLGTTWQLGVPRVTFRPDGRR